MTLTQALALVSVVIYPFHFGGIHYYKLGEVSGGTEGRRIFARDAKARNINTLDDSQLRICTEYVLLCGGTGGPAGGWVAGKRECAVRGATQGGLYYCIYTLLKKKGKRRGAEFTYVQSKEKEEKKKFEDAKALYYWLLHTGYMHS